jgi:hypothetical protein
MLAGSVVTSDEILLVVPFVYRAVRVPEGYGSIVSGVSGPYLEINNLRVFSFILSFESHVVHQPNPLILAAGCTNSMNPAFPPRHRNAV